MIAPERATRIGEVLRGLATHRPGFARRHSQDRMIVAATEAIEREGGIAVIEAPTGVGKSFGYLVPALLSAREHGRKLLVATATVALQRQVLADLGSLREATGAELRIHLVKGRGRYACDRNLRMLSGADPDQSRLDLGGDMESPGDWPFAPTTGEREALASLLDARITKAWDGDLDAWTGKEIGGRLRAAVTTGAAGCAGSLCPYVARCPAVTAKAETWKADVLVANLHVLLSDLALGGGALLPELEDCVLVIDEAHHLPQTAVSAFAGSLSLGDHKRRVKSAEKALSAAARMTQAKPETLARVHEALSSLDAHLTEAARRVLPVLEAASGAAKAPASRRVYGKPEVARLDERTLSTLRETMVEISASVRDVLRVMTRARKKLADASGPQASRLLRELGSANDWLVLVERTASLLDTEPDEGAPPVASWLERTAAGDVVLNATPVDASAMLRSELWSRCHSAILTSATLTSFGRFDRFAAQAGLSGNDAVSYVRLPSPFDLEAAAVLSVPAMRTAPSDGAAFVAEVVAALRESVDVGEGTLVLFASGALMRDVHAALPPSLAAITTCQGERPTASLLDTHRATIDAGAGSMLFGLATLAEGVDLPGAYNAHTIIVKLPFPVPDDPVMAVHSEWLTRRGLNPFNVLFLPEAFRRLVQACGRLIRTETDRGRITVLDRRLAATPYGRRMLEHLPPFRRDFPPLSLVSPKAVA